MDASVTYEQFKSTAFSEQGVCEDEKTKWLNCKNKKQMFDVLLSSRGIDYAFDATNKEWGMTPDVISSFFETFINGIYVSEQKGYNSTLFCEYEGAISAYSTLIGLVCCNVVISVLKHDILHIYAVSNSKIHIIGEGKVIINSYGNNIITFDNSAQVKVINKENRDNYE